MPPGRPSTKAPRPPVKSTKPPRVEPDSSHEHDDELDDLSGDSQDMANLEIRRMAEKMRKSVG